MVTTMYVSLEDLFTYRQYVDFPLAYCFDRETYSFCDASELKFNETLYYDRFVPMFRIDEKKLEYSYIMQLNNRTIYNLYRKNTDCFEAFLERNNMWDDWWDYYKKNVYHIAEQWCKDNAIVYIKNKT